MLVVEYDDHDGADPSLFFKTLRIQRPLPLCKQHVHEFVNAVWDTIHRDPPAEDTTADRPHRPVPPPTDLNHIREWARANGYQVSDRGRVPGNVIEAYAQAMGSVGDSDDADFTTKAEA